MDSAHAQIVRTLLKPRQWQACSGFFIGTISTVFSVNFFPPPFANDHRNFGPSYMDAPYLRDDSKAVPIKKPSS